MAKLTLPVQKEQKRNVRELPQSRLKLSDAIPDSLRQNLRLPRRDDGDGSMKAAQGFLMLVAGCVLSGCMSTNGALQPNTQFVYPNSKVREVGPVSSTRMKTGVLFFVPSFTAAEIRSAYDEALSSERGANVLVNFDEETKVTNYVLFNTVEYTIRGQSASMEVGKQRLDYDGRSDSRSAR